MGKHKNLCFPKRKCINSSKSLLSKMSVHDCVTYFIPILTGNSIDNDCTCFLFLWFSSSSEWLFIVSSNRNDRCSSFYSPMDLLYSLFHHQICPLYFNSTLSNPSFYWYSSKYTSHFPFIHRFTYTKTNHSSSISLLIMHQSIHFYHPQDLCISSLTVHSTS